MLKTRAHIFISGHVQGVFFRSDTKRIAEKYGVTGWVKNLSDGRVECLFEGEKEDLDKTIGFCKQGPPSAHVTDIEINWEKWKDEFVSFQIRY